MLVILSIPRTILPIFMSQNAKTQIYINPTYYHLHLILKVDTQKQKPKSISTYGKKVRTQIGNDKFVFIDDLADFGHVYASVEAKNGTPKNFPIIKLLKLMFQLLHYYIRITHK